MTRLLSCLAACAVLGAALPAHAQGGTKIGTLSCQVSSGWGFVFGSSRSVKCVFSSGKGHSEDYKGEISKFGVDVGYQHSGVMIWAVLAPTSDMKPGSLTGKYAGGTAGASVGVGLAANALIGGSSNHISLQPLSIEGMTGLNVAAGVAGLRLDYVANPS
jgi:hypothetical protein